MATTSTATAAIIGCTGLVGSHIVATALASTHFTTVHTISRRPAAAAAAAAAPAKLHAVVAPDATTWAAQLGELKPAPTVVFSALGTTRAQAGGLAGQWAIDHDANVAACGAARAAGAAAFVFVSSAGVRNFVTGRLPYSRMKVGVEDAVLAAGFPGAAILLRPGLLLGDREGLGQTRTVEGLASTAVGLIGRLLGQRARDAIAIDADVVARAAVRAAEIAVRGDAPSKLWVLEAQDIARLGRSDPDTPTPSGPGPTITDPGPKSVS